MRLKDRVAIITGAGSGMGRADSLLFAREGAKVVVNDINQKNIDGVVKEIEGAGGEALGYKADVTKMDEVEAMVEETVKRYGKVDILVSNAGWDELRPFLHTDRGFWDKILNLNLLGHMNCVKAVLPHMLKNKYGKIVTIGSDAGRLGNPMEAPYAAAKGGVIAFTKTIAREFGRANITANCVCPGITETPLAEQMISAIPEKEKALKMMETVRKVTPMGRLAKPEDVAGAVIFFASDDSSFVTGQVISVSGGLSTP
ncbi:MAG: glucose 1-dehydrogenase [Deltaproteobacteria bacterium]|nr:glucose 1-dehydrogenase [Deltaproteobacteria bacterium]